MSVDIVVQHVGPDPTLADPRRAPDLDSPERGSGIVQIFEVWIGGDDSLRFVGVQSSRVDVAVRVEGLSVVVEVRVKCCLMVPLGQYSDF